MISWLIDRDFLSNTIWHKKFNMKVIRKTQHSYEKIKYVFLHCMVRHNVELLEIHICKCSSLKKFSHFKQNDSLILNIVFIYKNIYVCMIHPLLKVCALNSTRLSSLYELLFVNSWKQYSLYNRPFQKSCILFLLFLSNIFSGLHPWD